ncbi:MAG TPA: biotin/lipoyl-containing protein, partial [Thermoanaerobaculia bacterium]
MAQWEFRLPDIGEGVVEGEIVKWLVQPGDEISEDQPLVEVMTDKATVTIPSPRKGKVLQTVGKEGEVAKVHGTLVVLEVDGGGSAEQTAHAPPTGQSAPSLPSQHAGSPAPLSTAAGPARAVQVSAPQARGQGTATGDGANGNGEQRGSKVL